MASTMTESSVDSFLKGVRSQIEVSKVKEEQMEKEEGEVEEEEGEIKGVAEEAKEVVIKLNFRQMVKELEDVTTLMLPRY